MFNTSYERASFSGSMMTVKVDGDNIFQCDFMGNPQAQVGKTVDSYKRLKDTCDKQHAKLEEYFNKLVEAGIEQPKKTPEEISREQSELMSKMLSTMNQMQEKINKLEGKSNDRFIKNASNGSESNGSKRPANIEPKRSS